MPYTATITDTLTATRPERTLHVLFISAFIIDSTTNKKSLEQKSGALWFMLILPRLYLLTTYTGTFTITALTARRSVASEVKTRAMLVISIPFNVDSLSLQHIGGFGKLFNKKNPA